MLVLGGCRVRKVDKAVSLASSLQAFPGQQQPEGGGWQWEEVSSWWMESLPLAFFVSEGFQESGWVEKTQLPQATSVGFQSSRIG